MNAPAPTPVPVRPGEVIRGKYHVEALVGEGGMAYVVAAWHLHLEQRVAIKLLRPGYGAETGFAGPGFAGRSPIVNGETVDPREMVERFLREARAASRLEGSHVARVLDVDTLENGSPFIVMEYLEGSDHDRASGDTGTHRAAEAFAEPPAYGDSGGYSIKPPYDSHSFTTALAAFPAASTRVVDGYPLASRLLAATGRTGPGSSPSSPGSTCCS